MQIRVDEENHQTRMKKKAPHVREHLSHLWLLKKEDDSIDMC